MSKTEKREAAAIFLFCFLLAFLTALVHFRLTMENHPAGSVVSIVSSQASLPFQYRLLSPLVAFGLWKVLPFHLLHVTFYLSLTILLFTYYYFYKFLRPHFSKTACLLGLFMMAASIAAMSAQRFNISTVNVAAQNVGIRYLSDLSQILFFLGLVHCLLQRKWAPWYALFALATLNRETTLLLLPAMFLVLRNREGISKAAGHVAASFLLWIGIKFALYLLFPGRIGDNMIADNLAVLSGKVGFKSYVNLLMVFGGMWVFAPLGLRRVPRETALLLITVPCAFAVFFVFANLFENRIYTELSVIVLPVSLAGLTRLIGDG